MRELATDTVFGKEISIKSGGREIAFDYIKAICTIMVVLHHCLNYYVTSYEYESVVTNTVILLLRTCHVPVFLLIAGYFCHEQPIIGFFKKKVLRVFIPFCFFSILKLIYSRFFSSEFSHGGTSFAGQIKYTFLNGTQYWFAYAILVMFLLAPLFWSRKQKKSYGLEALIVSYIVVCLLTAFPQISIPNYFQLDNVLWYLPYFAFGCFLFQHKAVIEMRYQQHKWSYVVMSAMVLTLLIAACSVKSELWVHPLRFFGAIGFFILIYSMFKYVFTKENNILHYISKYSLQVMFLDSFYRVLLFQVINRIIPMNIVLAVLIAVPTILLSVVSCLIAKKISVVRTLFGL